MYAGGYLHMSVVLEEARKGALSPLELEIVSCSTQMLRT